MTRRCHESLGFVNEMNRLGNNLPHPWHYQTRPANNFCSFNQHRPGGGAFRTVMNRFSLRLVLLEGMWRSILIRASARSPWLHWYLLAVRRCCPRPTAFASRRGISGNSRSTTSLLPDECHNHSIRRRRDARPGSRMDQTQKTGRLVSQAHRAMIQVDQRLADITRRQRR